MPQIFHRSFNTISKVTIFGAVFILAGAGWAYARYIRSSYATGVGLAREQPVPFSHQHHVAGLGIDCRYCHTSVEKSSFAGIPPVRTCMNCHNQIWVSSPLLEASIFMLVALTMCSVHATGSSSGTRRSPITFTQMG